MRRGSKDGIFIYIPCTKMYTISLHKDVIFWYMYYICVCVSVVETKINRWNLCIIMLYILHNIYMCVYVSLYMFLQITSWEIYRLIGLKLSSDLFITKQSCYFTLHLQFHRLEICSCLYLSCCFTIYLLSTFYYIKLL